MAGTITIGTHFQGRGFADYKATVTDGEGVIIKTIFHDSNQKHTVDLSREEWDRLVAWVEWRRKDRVGQYQPHSN